MCERVCACVLVRSKERNTDVHLSSLCDCVRGNTCVSLRHARLLNWRYTIRIHSFVARVARFSHAIYTITSVWLVWFVGFPDIILISNGLWLSRRTTVVEQSTRIIASDHYRKRRKKETTEKNYISKHVLSLIILPCLWTTKFYFLCLLLLFQFSFCWYFFSYVNVIKLEARVKFSLIKRVKIKQKVIKFFPLNGRRAHVNNI